MCATPFRVGETEMEDIEPFLKNRGVLDQVMAKLHRDKVSVTIKTTVSCLLYSIELKYIF